MFRLGPGACLFTLVQLSLAVPPSFSQGFPRQYLEGLKTLQSGNLTRAIVMMEEALKTRPDSAPIHSDLGTAYYRQRNFDRATREYAAAAKLEPNEAIYHNNLASALIRQNKPEQAVKSVRAALRLRPGFQDAIMNQGVILLLQDRYAEAEATLKKITDPTLRSLCNLALAQYHQFKWEEALKNVSYALPRQKSEKERKVLLAFREQIRSLRPSSVRELTGFQIALKGGYVDRRISSDYFDTTESIGAFQAEDFNSFSVEGEAGYRVHRYLSFSGSIGYFDGKETGLNKTTTTGVLLSGDVEFKVFYGLVTLKAHLPVRFLDFYIGVGTGWYNLKRKVKLANQVPQVARNAKEERNFSNIGFHGVGGVAINLSPRFFLLGEVRGFRAQFDDGTNVNNDKLDLGPLMYLGGVGVRF
ncbi:MAG: tetratricopeptide repeat protein [bacterium]